MATKSANKRGRRDGDSGHCSCCGEAGHYAKTCERRKAELAKAAELLTDPPAESEPVAAEPAAPEENPLVTEARKLLAEAESLDPAAG